MHEFDYVAPNSLEEVLELLKEKGSSARLLAGGTDLIVNMRIGRRAPSLVIDAKKVPELNRIEHSERGVEIGAAVSCRRLWEDQRIHSSFPALVDSTTLIGSVQIQGRASIGGNLCNAAPSADAVPTLIALGAIAHVRSLDGAREIPVNEFCTAPGKTALAADELLEKIEIPRPEDQSGTKFLRFIPRNEMDIAVVNAAAHIKLANGGTHFENVRVALGSVGPTPIFASEVGAYLIGKACNEENIHDASEIASKNVSPISDMRGTVEHRFQLVKVLTQRALHGAVDRARGIS